MNRTIDAEQLKSEFAITSGNKRAYHTWRHDPYLLIYLQLMNISYIPEQISNYPGLEFLFGGQSFQIDAITLQRWRTTGAGLPGIRQPNGQWTKESPLKRIKHYGSMMRLFFQLNIPDTTLPFVDIV